jgi:hypothetical protein
MTGGLLATLLATSSSEFSPKFNIAAETGMLEHSDPHWELVDSWQESGGGLRFGYNLSPKVGVVTSYQGSTSSSTLNNGGNYDYDSEYSSGLSNVESIMTERLITIGPKINFGSKNWFVPYATVQGLVAIGTLEVGDNASDEENSTTYFKDTAAGFGALGALGVEIRTRPISGKLQPIMYFEFGGGVSSALTFSVPEIGVDGADMPIGDLKYGGQHFRFGVGTQF